MITQNELNDLIADLEEFARGRQDIHLDHETGRFYKSYEHGLIERLQSIEPKKAMREMREYLEPYYHQGNEEAGTLIDRIDIFSLPQITR